MASEDNEIIADLYPICRFYKNGRVERFYEYFNCFYVPPSLEDPATGVSSKDITISPHVSARLYLPKISSSNEKYPVLVFYHGGGLIIGSAFYNKVHRLLNQLVSKSNAICVSVEYRLAPENDLSILYEDCWTALQWVASHHSENNNSTNTNKDSWLINYGDFNRVFIAGESAGGNIAYHMAMRAGEESLNGDVKILGSILACPYFLIPDTSLDMQDNFAYKMWITICPQMESGLLSAIDSPIINPLAEKAPSLSGLGCSRLFVCISEKDILIPREIMFRFVEGVKKSGWNGELEFFEVEGEEHCFFVEDPEVDKAKDVINRFASFIQHV